MKSRWPYWGGYLLLIVLWALLVWGGRSLSFSMDEPSHITRGYTFLARWKAGFWYFTPRSHPPLINSMEAFLLFLTRPHLPLETLPGWGKNFAEYVTAFLPYLMPMERTAMLARIPVMGLTVLLGALVFRWGKEMSGTRTGVLALALMTFNPNMLAHGGLATTDAGVTVVGTAALYAGWRWLARPSWKWTVIAGLLLGLTLLAKLSGIVWCGAFALMAGGITLLRWRQEGAVRAAQTITAGLAAILVLWAAFGFSFGPTSFFPAPLPAPLYWAALNNQAGTAARRIFIAFGEIWTGRQWWYFPLNFMLKNPIPLLAALPISIWAVMRSGRGLTYSRFAALFLFPGLYGLAAIVKGLNVSYRHMLPIHPFLWLMVGEGMWLWLRRRRSIWPYLVWGIIGGWYIFGTLRVFPDELAYFNELAGGPEGGYRYLVDYTQDWGQSYKELQSYLDAHPGPAPHIVYFTRAHPGYYGISFIPPSDNSQRRTPFYPQPGRYVIGISRLYGLVGSDSMKMDWFRRAPAADMVGHALFVYDVVDTPAWLSQCITPAIPLDEAAIAEGFGPSARLSSPKSADSLQSDDGGLRQVEFDCASTWLYPSGTGLGVYALHHDLLTEQGHCLNPLRCDPFPASSFIARHLAQARLSYEQRDSSLLPAFALYEYKRGKFLQPLLTTVWAASAGTRPGALKNAPPLTTPASLQGPLDFLGAAVYPASDGLEVETWWRVTEQPITRLFSIMAHVVTEEGQMVGEADGLGITPSALTAGDVVVQRHHFSGLASKNRLWLRTGAYWLDTDINAQWAIAGMPGADAFFVPLEEKR